MPTVDKAPGGSFAKTWQIALIAIYLVLLGTFSLGMLIHCWPRCIPDSAATSSSPAGTEAPTERDTETGTETGTETEATAGTEPSPENAAAATPSPDPVAPKRGPTEGGTPVVLRGSGFLKGAQVHFGEGEASDVEVINAGMITARTPPHEAGPVTVEVANPGGTGNWGPIFIAATRSPAAGSYFSWLSPERWRARCTPRGLSTTLWGTSSSRGVGC